MGGTGIEWATEIHSSMGTPKGKSTGWAPTYLSQVVCGILIQSVSPGIYWGYKLFQLLCVTGDILKYICLSLFIDMFNTENVEIIPMWNVTVIEKFWKTRITEIRMRDVYSIY